MSVKATPLKLIRYGENVYTLNGVYAEIGSGENIRWVTRRKMLLVLVINKGLATKEEILRKYPYIQPETLEFWVKSYESGGANSMRITKYNSRQKKRFDT